MSAARTFARSVLLIAIERSVTETHEALRLAEDYVDPMDRQFIRDSLSDLAHIAIRIGEDEQAAQAELREVA